MLKYLIQRSKWIIVAVGLAIFFLTQCRWLVESDLWQRTEGLRIDQRYRWRGTKSPDPNIVLVGLEGSTMSLDALAPEEIAASETLQLMKEPWPWDRRVYAAVLEKLMHAGAKVVVFDFVFAGATDGDEAFAQALEKYKNHVVIGSMFREESGEKTEKYIPPNPRLFKSGTEQIVGLVNLWPDADGIVRAVKYRTSIEREYDATFRTNLLANFPDNLEHVSLRAVEKFGKQIATPSQDETSYIDFQGPRGTYPVLPIEQLFVKKLWQAPPFRSGIIFSNKIVIVGPIAEIFQDMHSTPFGDTPGPEVQAQLIGALLHHSFIKPTSRAANLALELFMVGLALVVCLFVGNALLKVLLMIFTTLVFLVGGQILFENYNLLVSMTPPLFCLLATGSFGVTFQFALEQVERRRTLSLLRQHVSKNVAKIILEDQRGFKERQKGRKQPVTILFSDIRGFTGMTEASDPEKLVAQLNEYFAEMVGIVDQQRGTLQKFIGDAIMAAWGDTFSDGVETDAQRAVSAALQMRPALETLNAAWTENPDRQKLAIGIGINHGEVVVGNIGTEERSEFTVLGDGVNLAARLETATKQFHTDILIGETVEALTRGKFVYREVGAVAFKGKTKPVKVFTLLSDRSQSAPAWLAKYHEAIQLYRGREFDRAEEMFKTALGEIGGQDFLCEMYLRHCSEFRAATPGPKWNGSFSLSEK